MATNLPLSRANDEEKEEIETFRMPQPTWTRKRKRQVSAPADVKKVKAEKKEEQPDAKRRTPIYRDTSELYRLHRPGDEDYVLSHAIAGDLFVWRFKLRWEFIPLPDDEVSAALVQRQKDLEEARDEETEMEKLDRIPIRFP